MTILQMSLYSSILILAVIVIRSFMLYRLPKSTFLVLWGIVIFKLLIPFSITSSLSIFTLADNIKGSMFFLMSLHILSDLI